jgi:hypothetical protein
MGVGIVRNTANGKALLVSGTDVPSLLNRHRAQLRLDSHRNRALQQDWNAQGGERFEFAILDTLTPSDEPGYDPRADLEALEALWLEKLRPFEPAGYQHARRDA